MPLDVINAERAFVLYFKDRVDVIEYYDETFNTINDEYLIPSVVKIKDYVKYRYDNVPLTRTNIYKRDNFECVYCGSSDNLTIDHVIPKSKGGRHTWKNVVTACKTCNAEKADFVKPELPKKFDIDLSLFKPYSFILYENTVKEIPNKWKPYLLH